MSSLSDSGEPELVKLRKWGQFRPKISEFHQFFISPARELLLFLSYRSEALLISLSQDRSSEAVQIIPSWKGDLSSEVLDSDEKFEHSTESPGTENKKLPKRGRSLLEQPAVICNVQSVAWSHCGDAYDQNGESSYGDILFVSSGDEIHVHAFNSHGEMGQYSKSSPETDVANGKWVVWGPTFKDSRALNEVSDDDARRDDSDGFIISDSVDIAGSKSWLRSFLVYVDLFHDADDSVLRFPAKSSLPCSAEIMSFNIFERILMLLEHFTGNAGHVSENTSDLADFKSVIDDSDTEGHSIKPPRKDMYRCSSVFSSTYDHYVGLALTHTFPHYINEEYIACSKTIVIILTVSVRGLKWTCSVDLQESSSGWVDFQIVKGLLICLTGSGLICMFDAERGDVILHVDVLKNSLVYVKGNSKLDERTSFAKGDSSPMKEGNTGEFRLARADSDVTPKRVFRRLLFTSQSPALAVVDENGVIYSVDIIELLVKESHEWSSDFKGAMSPFQKLGWGMLSSWKVASSGIGHHKEFSEFFTNSVRTLSGKISASEFEPSEGKLTVKSMDEEMDSYPSGFSVHSKDRCSQIARRVKAGVRRRVFLPLDKYRVHDAISFSPFGITRLVRINTEETQLLLISLQAATLSYDDSLISAWTSSFIKGSTLGFAAMGCCFEGFLYVVTDEGLYVVLPSLSVSSGHTVSMPLERCQQKDARAHQKETLDARDVCRNSFRPWQLEVLDRTLLYEGSDEADYFCVKTGWDLKIARMRRMELGLHYLRFDEIERSLEKLADVILAEEGMLRLLLASAHKIFCKVGTESEMAQASRLLTLAASFATKLIQRYGMIELEEYWPTFEAGMKQTVETNISRRLEEMAHYLEVIRNVQQRLYLKSRKPTIDGGDASNAADPSTVSDETSPVSISFAFVNSFEAENQEEKVAVSSADSASNGTDLFSLSKFSQSVDGGIGFQPSRNALQEKILIPRELSREMITRWELDSFDLKTVVEDALNSDRVPLAVLLLHLKHQREMISEQKPRDSFEEVCDVGRAIAYGLFLQGESGLAIATLQKLGEEIKSSLHQLLFGTLRRSIRSQVFEEMKKLGYLKLHDLNKLEGLSLIERFYPSSSFWGTYFERQRQSKDVLFASSLSEEHQLQLRLHMWIDLSLQCDEIDGAVIGSWRNISMGSDFPMTDEGVVGAGYWVCAAIWSDSWDQTTMDRIALDQSLTLGVDVPWESKFQYHLAHNDWDQIQELLDMVPPEILVDGVLRINLSCSHLDSPSNAHHLIGVRSSENLGPDFVIIPNVKILKLSVTNICSSLIKILLEQELAKRLIFLKEYWDSTAEIMPILARTHLIYNSTMKTTIGELNQNSSDSKVSESDVYLDRDTLEALHRLVVHYCVQYGLPHLLNLYLDHHNLLQDGDSLCSLKESAGTCQWAKWLLFSRAKGHVYDSSFANARAILPNHDLSHDGLTVLDADKVICTIDDMAAGEREVVALATLVYAPVPIQKCLLKGIINRNSKPSFQCTLRNLQPGLQNFPTLWSTLISASAGHDSVPGWSRSPDYRKWRGSIFSSAGGDTSLVQMLPYWLPKSVRRLVKLFAQDPGESLSLRESGSFTNMKNNAIFNCLSWEASIDKCIKEELYSSFEEKEFSIEHHLHGGHTLGVFNHLLALRAQKYKAMHAHQQASGTNVQADVQTLLEPLTEDEEPIFSSVMPLAIVNFGDSGFVASCVFLLELLGLSTSMLHVDISALRRISSYNKDLSNSAYFTHVEPANTVFHSLLQEDSHTVSLARALADNYQQLVEIGALGHKDSDEPCLQPPRILVSVLHNLEKSSLPSLEKGKTCGFWLKNGNGDGTEFRSQQKADSKHWSLVTEFCRMHNLPLSTKYLAFLARDNDWVGFLTEAQQGGFPIDTVIRVASEFGDLRLRLHILTVLRSMQSVKKRSDHPTSSTSTREFNEMSFTESQSVTPIELFALVADCEKQKNPGEVLLQRAKDLRWSLLAMIASCFPDVSSLSCLRVWLEITAARETSSIKVNDISSQILRDITVAVKSTNEFSINNASIAFPYDRRSSKRRRYLEPESGDHAAVSHKNIPAVTEVTSTDEQTEISHDTEEALMSLSNMVAVLCEQQFYLPLLRAFDMFLPLCSLLPFVRFLQAFSQMRLSEASAHLASFSARIKEEPYHFNSNTGKDESISASWVSSIAVKAANAVLSTCPSAYERICLLRLLEASDFGDGGTATACFRREYWKVSVAEPLLHSNDDVYLEDETLDDTSLLMGLVKRGKWEEARHWAKLIESSDDTGGSSVHLVTEMQAEAMVAEYKEFLWDVAEERSALWGHCQGLFARHSLPPLQAGKFFLRHAQALEREITAREVHEILLLSLQWLSGTVTLSNPVYPLHLLREMETRVWLLALESESHSNPDQDYYVPSSLQNPPGGNITSIIEHTETIISKMDNHINKMQTRTKERQMQPRHLISSDTSTSSASGNSLWARQRGKVSQKDTETVENSSTNKTKNSLSRQYHTYNAKIDSTEFTGWEEQLRPVEFETAILSLLEYGQVTAARQLQQKLSPSSPPSELRIIDVALRLASILSPSSGTEVSLFALDPELASVIESYGIRCGSTCDIVQVLEALATKCCEGGGRGLCNKIVAVVQASKVLGLSFSEAFEKRPIELLQLLSLKAQDSLEEARLLAQTHSMPPPSIAKILAESFLKGLLAAHRGGYMDSQNDEGPAPLLWRISDFLKWAELCPFEQEIGHALTRLVMTGQEIPHTCEVELLILAHHFYKLSGCLDGVDVLVALAAKRVESYVSEEDFACLVRLVTGVSNFHALNFILSILIENDQLELLLHKFSTADPSAVSATEAATAFRMAVLTALQHFDPHDLDASAMVYSQFDMKHETGSLQEQRAEQCLQQWLSYPDRARQSTEPLLESMRLLTSAAEVYVTVDAGHKAHRACARASLLSLQLRIPDALWTDLSDTNARRAMAEQPRFQEALLVAQAYALNNPGEWAPALWARMLRPDLIELFLTEFAAALPLQPTMLLELARFYRAEVVARGEQSHFSVWLSPGGLPAEWVRHLGKSMRCLLRKTRDLRLRAQLAALATGFNDVVDACNVVLDKVPDLAGPLILRKGHGGAYLPLV